MARQLAAYLVLPNLPFWLLGIFAYLTRPVVNVDYLVYGAIAPLLPHWLAIAGFCVLLLNDALFSLAPVFHFGLDTAVASLRYATSLGSGFLVFAGALAASVLAVATLTHHISNRRTSLTVATSLACVTVIILSGDLLSGASRFWRVDRVRTRINLATSAAYATGSELLREWTAPRLDLDSLQLAAVSSGAGQLAAALDAGSPQHAPNILLVIVESLGSLRESALDSGLVGPLIDSTIRGRYDVRRGAVTSSGATTSGELRELCAVQADYRLVGAVAFDHCLPRQAKGRGYETVAIHGYTGRFFRRYQWYPLVGFDRTLFGEQLTRRGDVRVCGTMFHGARDTDVARVVREELQSSTPDHPRLVYWLTLNGHLPIDPSCIDGRPAVCPVVGLAGYPAEVCTLTELHRAVMSAVAEIALDSTLPPMRIVLVGDHPPPFLSRASRAAFAEDRVPFVELVPRHDRAKRTAGRDRVAGSTNAAQHHSPPAVVEQQEPSR